jgi:hypothetical protein
MMFTAAWVIWLVAFVAIEAWALVRKKRGDTLSEHTWDWFCLKGSKGGKSTWCVVRRVTFVAFWAWLTIHFVTGGAWL